jgi:hypothetical protein
VDQLSGVEELRKTLSNNLSMSESLFASALVAAFSGRLSARDTTPSNGLVAESPEERRTSSEEQRDRVRARVEA